MRRRRYRRNGAGGTIAIVAVLGVGALIAYGVWSEQQRGKKLVALLTPAQKQAALDAINQKHLAEAELKFGIKL